jgi:hypothetical protein
MELKSDRLCFLYRKDIARKSSHKEMVTLILIMLCCLKTNLSLWMFVPCDKDGKIMEEPQSIKKHIYSKAIMELL